MAFTYFLATITSIISTLEHQALKLRWDMKIYYPPTPAYLSPLQKNGPYQMQRLTIAIEEPTIHTHNPSMTLV